MVGLCLIWGPKLDIANFMIKITELEGEAIKLISLINHAQTSGAIHYDDVNFLPYPPNNNLPKIEFFNLFLGFKAKPALQIDYDLVNPILWHIEHILNNSDKKLAEYFIWWI